MVKGLPEASGRQVVAARKTHAFTDVDDLAHRAELNRHDMEALAAAGALENLSGHRRNALWDVSGVEHMPPLLADSSIDDVPPMLFAPSEGENLVADYASLGLTLGRHPLALLRERLQRQNMRTAAELRDLPHGRITRVTGLVTGRQRPGTASGVTFVTLEDETGMINVIVWRDLAERQLLARGRGNQHVPERLGIAAVFGRVAHADREPPPPLQPAHRLRHAGALGRGGASDRGTIARPERAARQADDALARFSLTIQSRSPRRASIATPQ